MSRCFPFTSVGKNGMIELCNKAHRKKGTVMATKKKTTKKAEAKKPESLQAFLNDMGRRLAKEMSKDLGK